MLCGTYFCISCHQLKHQRACAAYVTGFHPEDVHRQSCLDIFAPEYCWKIRNNFGHIYYVTYWDPDEIPLDKFDQVTAWKIDNREYLLFVV